MNAEPSQKLNVEILPVLLPLAPELAGIHAECFGAECWSISQMLGSLMLITTQGWVAMADDQIAGFILFQGTGEELEVLTFCVRPAIRRQGIAESLLRHMQNNLPPGGVVHLEVAADNNAARGLYEKCGFAIVNTRKDYYRRGEGWADAVCYHYAAAGEKTGNLQA